MDLIDFGILDYYQTFNKQKEEPDNYNKYDSTTTEHYKTMREMHLDPITEKRVDNKYSFEYKYMWDPCSGERREEDKYGPLYFDVNSLAYNFYMNRLRMLWTEGSLIDGIQYEGYYGDGIGSGEELNIIGRGNHTNQYLFRLPIIDCYLEKDFDLSIITMGPKLTREDIEEINKKINKKLINIDLIDLYDTYHEIIKKNVDYKKQCKLVDKIRKMKCKYNIKN
jgi:hypothetical protein